MLIGYARVSTSDQNPALQLDALNAAGCTEIFEEVRSGADNRRPVLRKCLGRLRRGDTLVVWKLDRLARTTIRLFIIVQKLQRKGIEFKCMTQPIDTTSAAGKLVFAVFAAIAEFEREMIRERVTAGLKAAKARGIRPGPASSFDGRLELEPGESMADAARALGVNRATIYRKLDQQHIEEFGCPMPRVRKPKPKPKSDLHYTGNKLYRLNGRWEKRQLLEGTAEHPAEPGHYQG